MPTAALTFIFILIFTYFLAQNIGYDRIQRAFLKLNAEQASLSGITLILIALCSFLFFATTEIKSGSYINGFDLIFKYHLLFAAIIFLSSVVSIIILFAPIKILVDKFRYATLFAMVNFVSIFTLGIIEIPKNFTSMPHPKSGLGFLGGGPIILTSLLCILIFGLQSNKTLPKNIFFKFIRRIGAKIQENHDRDQAAYDKYQKDKNNAAISYKKFYRIVQTSIMVFCASILLLLSTTIFIPAIKIKFLYATVAVLFITYMIWLTHYFKKNKPH